MTRRALFVRLMGFALTLSCLLPSSAITANQAAKQKGLSASQLFTTADAERVMGYRLHLIQATDPVTRSGSEKRTTCAFALPSDPAISPINKPIGVRSYRAIVIVTFAFIDPASYTSQRNRFLHDSAIRDLTNVGEEGWASLDDNPGMIVSARVGDVEMSINIFFEYSPGVSRKAVANRLIDVAREVATRIR